MTCTPSWKKDGKCPYGTKLPFDVTKPKKMTAVKMFYIVGSYIAVLSIGIVLYMLKGAQISTKKKIIIIVGMLIGIVVNEFVLKKMFKQSRPNGSCSVKCGFPSSHSVLTSMLVGVSCYLAKYQPNKKLGYSLTSFVAGLWLWTIISRVGLNDHSIFQVTAGSMVGGVWGAGIYYLIDYY
jgi:membrane-associated phospholipid phosphatase